MKKIVMLAMCMCAYLGLFAQEGSGKDVILVDYFTYTESIGDSYPTTLRHAVIGGLQATGRLVSIDADAESGLKLEKDRRNSEEAMGDATARRSEMKKLGANYMLKIHVTQMDASQEKKDDGSTWYSGLINFTLTLVNVEDGTVKVSKPFNYAGLNAKYGDTKEAAITATIDYVKISMKKFVNDNFDLKASIVAIENVDKKKGAVSLYIDCGESMGVKKGHTFIVRVEKQVAGKTLYTEIGRVKVDEVQGDDMSLCKVTKGGVEIQKADQDKKKMVVTYKPSVLDGVGSSIKEGLK